MISGGTTVEQITSLSEHISDNRIIADAQKSSMDGSKIIFNGSGNILVIEDGVRCGCGKESFVQV